MEKGLVVEGGESEIVSGQQEANSLFPRENTGNHFGSAQALWDDPDLLAIPARTEEVRFIVIGRIKGKHWTGIITYRGENSRIISVRRSRPEEVAIYES